MSPLAAMAGDAATMLNGAPSQPSADQAQAEADPRAQARGAIQIASKVRQFNQDQFAAIATQFPQVSKEANDLLQLIDRGMQQLVKKLISTVELPEPSAPTAVR